MNMNQLVEDAILGRLITTMIDDGFRIEISDQDGGGLYLYAVADGGFKPETGYEYWIRLNLGAGPTSVIADYSTNLEATISSVNDFAASFETE